MSRVYLDHNATTPLRRAARDAMIAAMDVVGNPSSVHGEGRAAKGLVERARAQVAQAVGCEPSQVVFTSSATEAAALAAAQKTRHGGVFAALATEHDCVGVWADEELPRLLDKSGAVSPQGGSAFLGWLTMLAGDVWQADRGPVALVGMSAANSETGVLLASGKVLGSGRASASRAGTVPYSTLCDITQLVGKMPVVYQDTTPSYAILSAHKLGGPKGVGALINFTPDDPLPMLRGGGQEMNRRSGTENVIGIAGFGAAIEAAMADLEAGVWARVEKLRTILESGVEAASKETILVGKDADRLPNTSCLLTPGWKGETQVMAMDLAGFAISAGSACSSGKVKASRVLMAMGYTEADAACAIRVSLGRDNTEQDVTRFVDVWTEKLKKHRVRAAV
ncbi:cysteine desulfurase [Octadecabacter sp.]|nr:cysteine desulfurase [Octadecabacter sp.]